MDKQNAKILMVRASLCGLGLRKIREERKVGLRVVARGVQMDPAHLSRLEQGKCGARMEILEDMAGVYGFSSVGKMIERAEKLQRAAQ
jgi:transcriptional regulator with XRE-family HTH domain